MTLIRQRMSVTKKIYRRFYFCKLPIVCSIADLKTDTCKKFSVVHCLPDMQSDCWALSWAIMIDFHWLLKYLVALACFWLRSPHNAFLISWVVHKPELCKQLIQLQSWKKGLNVIKSRSPAKFSVLSLLAKICIFQCWWVWPPGSTFINQKKNGFALRKAFLGDLGVFLSLGDDYCDLCQSWRSQMTNL